ncbi:UDP-N-acetylmuramoyl-L-alanine--D-glutamate ligase [Enterobacteriaceae endosymbiont of Plateumaris consimilis]|uniref:UDP-N-acetylmuramoyl-L-alanine--D-glutamate ligase n=1 Tax=Enterobacteriaceae endosymbiont of Plateumaris consimilis TaxID=2675794 RepID=UPI001449021A|nr:UDP-N-acetylmuramoyl-L-alanine--D-glutamate ligase [Enterobacteriaceae endosymbiont of Plateumaris consimilis]QJC28554.1 UDP-N-acetylmuramoyl-L-alanine--D-glutamate ligase [Enterobacteriaceae endosymbiont of Plateumaris consimilis]
MTKKILIIGLGITGISCIKFFIKKGIIPYVMDSRINPPYIEEIPSSVKYCIGSFNKDWILNANLIVISPGISLFHPLLIDAAKKGIKIIGDIELFYNSTKTPIIAITGTNGKSTVTNMIGKIINNYYSAGIGGNIGYPALDLLSSFQNFYVIEISSFQLETIKKFKPFISVILNISSDHIDRYPLGIKQYQKTKLKIYKNSSICIYNANDVLTYPNNLQTNQQYISFGIKKGKYQLYKNHNNNYLKINNNIILNFNNTKLIGTHNYVNALAVLAIADALNIPRTISLKYICNYQLNNHTLQIIYKKNGVTWINDSKSTNVDSTKAALNFLGKNKRIWLLLGGYDKNCEFHLLKKYLMNNKINIYCFGLASKKIMSLYPKAIPVKTMADAIKKISKLLKRDDIVLLSPACSSVDQFIDFKDRGTKFIELVKQNN